MMPVNVHKFVEKAHTRGADAVMLDLEDAVPDVKKENARNTVRKAIEQAGGIGGQVFVRINNEPTLLEEDIKSSICMGLTGIVVPKAEDHRQISMVSDLLNRWENDRNIEKGSVKISILIETIKGVLNLAELAVSSPRVDSMIFGTEDFCLDLGVEPSPTGQETFLALSEMILHCKVNRLVPIGQLGSVADFQDLAGVKRSALVAKGMGCEGGFCIHPRQVEILNEIYSPSPKEIDYAERVVTEYSRSLNAGAGSISVDGKMVDRAILRRAQAIMDRADAIKAAGEKD